jgi:5'-3' exonuclease
MTRAIIDVDSYLYKAALTCNELIEIQEGIYYEAYNINKAKAFLTETFNNLAGKCNCDEYILVTGGVGTNFRNIINPEYKANRKKQAKPIMLDKVRELVFNTFPTVYFPYLEADDTCRILMEENKDDVIVSPDKDLRTFVGKVYDSYHDEVRYITPVQAEANFKRQLLIGDKIDGYSGIPKIGPARADKLLIDGVKIDDIIQMYADAGLGLETFETVYNCAKILGKEDYNNGVITLYGGKKLDLNTYQG